MSYMRLRRRQKFPKILLMVFGVSFGILAISLGIFFTNPAEGEPLPPGVNRFTALQVDVPDSKVELGRRLFFDKRLSGDAADRYAYVASASVWFVGAFVVQGDALRLRFHSLNRHLLICCTVAKGRA